MDRYDAMSAPNPQDWLSLDESERIHLVENYHRNAGIHLPDATIHAVAHAVIENQLALGFETPKRTFERIMGEGLDRHEAIHALATILMEVAYDVSKNDPRVAGDQGLDQIYYSELEKLTAEGWRRRADEDDDG
jgi:hypothetical protein